MPSSLDRRGFVAATAAAIGAAVLFRPSRGGAAAFPVAHSGADWHRILEPRRFAVLRHAATEAPFSSPLLKEHRRGTFVCAGCELALFSSTTKFDSGTGWPSFYAPIEGAVATERDTAFGMVRTAVHCRRCGGHLGHVFDDGPKPTGLRYCMNGVALVFKPQPT